jgi:AbrB family looped-hinge helix DNA binding protein
MDVKRVRISTKGQVTIPKELREEFNLHPEDDVLLVPIEDGILLKRPKTSLRGFLKGKFDIESLEKDIRELRKEWTLKE